MTDVYIANVQLNTDDITCNITSTSNSKEFAVYNQAIYGQLKPVLDIPSGTTHSYKFSITIKHPNNYTLLINKLRELYDGINLVQVIQKKPVLIKTSDTSIYLNINEVFVLLEDFSYTLRGEDGINHINIEINALVFGIPTTSGGDVDVDDPWNTGAVLIGGIAQNQIGLVEVGF